MSDLRDSELRDYENLLRDYHAVVAGRDQALRELGEARASHKLLEEALAERTLQRDEARSARNQCAEAAVILDNEIDRVEAQRDAALRSTAELTRERDAIRAELSSDRRAWQNFIDETAAQRDFAIMDMLAAQKSTAELRGALEVFAKLADALPDHIPDAAMVVLTNTNGGMIDTRNRVSVGNLRAARTALASSSTKET